MKTNIGKWTIVATEDEDGHLTLSVTHEDGSEVIVCNEDVSVNDNDWSERFTTKHIEDSYNA